MKTPAKPSKPVAKGGTPLPEGARHVPGARATEAEKGAPLKEPRTLDPGRFLGDARGGPELKVPHGVRILDNRTISRR
jgi:hypothetical protein